MTIEAHAERLIEPLESILRSNIDLSTLSRLPDLRVAKLADRFYVIGPHDSQFPLTYTYYAERNANPCVVRIQAFPKHDQVDFINMGLQKTMVHIYRWSDSMPSHEYAVVSGSAFEERREYLRQRNNRIVDHSIKNCFGF
jgi:hypothetical protein